MLRVVLDTNVFISGTILSHGNSFKILQSWRKQDFFLLTSPGIIKEISDVVSYPKFSKRYHIEPADIEALIQALCLESFITSAKDEIKVVIDDPDDNKFLSCAIEGRADYIVSGDSHLLDLKEYQGVKIIAPKDFLKLLRETW